MKNAIAASILSAIKENTTSMQETAEKLMKARTQAEQAYKLAQEKHKLTKASIDEAIVELKNELNKLADDENQAAERAYNDALVGLGLKKEDHPFTPVVQKADEVITVTLSAAGAGARKVADIGNGIANRFMQGFKK